MYEVEEDLSIPGIGETLNGDFLKGKFFAGDVLTWFREPLKHDVVLELLLTKNMELKNLYGGEMILPKGTILHKLHSVRL